MELLDQWGEAAQRIPGKGPGRRYPAGMRASAVRLASTALAAGVRPGEVCRRLGIPDVTLRVWMRQVKLVPIEVVPEGHPGVRLCIGSGHAEVSIEQLSQLLGMAR
jgi:hypothetical protein